MKFLLCKILAFTFCSTCLGIKGNDDGKLVIKKLEKFNADPKTLTVTGFSSGGAQSMQYHLSHSSKIYGAGIFSGVPYLYGWERKRQDFFVNDIEEYNLTEVISATETYSIIGSIDPVENIKNTKVYVYHGSKDSTVESGSGLAIENIYKHFGADLNCFINLCEGEHGMPTENYGGPCGYLSIRHYLSNDCKYQGVHEMYKHLYGEDIVKPILGSVGTVPLEGEFYGFDQTEFFDDKDPHGMDNTGFVYVPSGCANKTCKISFVFHGCLQSKLVSNTISLRAYFGDKFPRTTGYLEVAELNGIIQVYPQTKKSYRKPKNPSACWDWMGFTSKDYPTRFGYQTASVDKMVNRAVFGI